MTPEIALKCINDIKEKIESNVPLVQNKTFWVYSEEDLISSAAKFIKKPCVGIMYEGLRNVGTQHAGLNTGLSVALAVVMEGKQIAGLDRKEDIVLLLDQLRAAIRDTLAPTGKKWAFVLEVPTANIANNVIYLQRWTTGCII